MITSRYERNPRQRRKEKKRKENNLFRLTHQLKPNRTEETGKEINKNKQECYSYT